MTHRLHRTIDAIIGGLEKLNVNLPAARATLLADLAVTGEPRAATTDGTGRGTSEHTPTEAAALNRDHLQRQLDNLTAELDACSRIVTNLNNDCTRIIGHRTDTPRCDGGVGRDGYLIPRNQGGWSDPGCHNVPADGRKTCDACRQRADRWKRQRATSAA